MNSWTKNASNYCGCDIFKAMGFLLCFYMDLKSLTMLVVTYLILFSFGLFTVFDGSCRCRTPY